jgi:hypothetical protein
MSSNVFRKPFTVVSFNTLKSSVARKLKKDVAKEFSALKEEEVGDLTSFLYYMSSVSTGGCTLSDSRFDCRSQMQQPNFNLRMPKYSRIF